MVQAWVGRLTTPLPSTCKRLGALLRWRRRCSVTELADKCLKRGRSTVSVVSCTRTFSQATDLKCLFRDCCFQVLVCGWPRQVHACPKASQQVCFQAPISTYTFNMLMFIGAADFAGSAASKGRGTAGRAQECRGRHRVLSSPAAIAEDCHVSVGLSEIPGLPAPTCIVYFV